MPIRPLHCLFTLGRAVAQGLRRRLLAATRPIAAPVLAVYSVCGQIWHSADRTARKSGRME